MTKRIFTLLMISAMILLNSVQVFATKVGQCGAAIVQGDETFLLDIKNPISLLNCEIPEKGIKLVNGSAVYELTLPFYSDRVTIKTKSGKQRLEMIINGVSEKIELNEQEVTHVFETPVRMGEKTIELKGTADITEVIFGQITEEKPYEALDYGRTNYEEATKTAFIIKEGSPVIKVNSALRYLDYSDISVVPIYVDGSLYIPAKPLAEAMSCYFEEDKEKGFFVIRKDDRELVYIDGKTVSYTNISEKADSTVVPYEHNGTTYLPVRAVSEFFGRYVYYKNGFVISDYRSRAKDLAENWYTELSEEFSNYMPTGNSGKTYYVAKSANASDLNDGSINAPFATIKKASQVAKAGDTIVIREGRWSELIKPVNDGTATAPITYKAMEGEEVMLYACDEVSGFTEYKDGIVVAPVTWDLGFGRNQVFYKDKALVEGRYPNSDVGEDGLYLYRSGLRLDPHYITIGDIKVNPKNTMEATSETLLQEEEKDYWKDAIFITHMGYAWTHCCAVVKSSEKGKITFGDTSQYWWFGAEEKYPNFGFLTNNVNTIDLPGEWTMKNNLLYIKLPEGETADTLKLMVKRRQLLADLDNRKHIRLEGLKGFGGSVKMNDSEMCVIDSCDFQYISHYTFAEDNRGLYIDTDLLTPNGAPERGEVGIYISGNNNAVVNSFVKYSAGDIIFMTGCYSYISNNVFTHAGYAGGSGATIAIDMQAYKPIDEKRGGHTVTNNTIRYNATKAIGVGSPSTAVMAERPSYLPVEFAYNDISDVAVATLDVGLIYCWGTALGDDFTRSSIHHNYVYQTAPYPERTAAALYMDNYTLGVDVRENLIFAKVADHYQTDAFEQNVINFPGTNSVVDSWNNINPGVKNNAKADLKIEDFPNGKPYKTGSSLIEDDYSLTYDSYKSDSQIYYASDAILSEGVLIENNRAKFTGEDQWIKFENVDFDKGNTINLSYSGDYYKAPDKYAVIIGESEETGKKVEVELRADSKSLTDLNHAEVFLSSYNFIGKQNVWIKPVGTTHTSILQMRLTNQETQIYDFTGFNYDHKKIMAGTYSECNEETTMPLAEGLITRLKHTQISLQYPVIGGTWGGNWCKYPNVKINESVNKFKILISSGGKYSENYACLRIGSPDGEILAKIKADDSGWKYVEKSDYLTRTLDPGTYDIYITFDGDGGCSDFAWFGLE